MSETKMDPTNGMDVARAMMRPADPLPTPPTPGQQASRPSQDPCSAPRTEPTWGLASIPMVGSAQSECICYLAASLAAAQAKIRGAIKDTRNSHLGNKYADLGSVWQAWQEVGPVMGLALVQVAEAGPESVTVLTTLAHVSGQWIRGSLTLPWGMTKGLNPNQALGSALTYARRYALAAMVGVCPEDDDASSASPPHEAKRPEKRDIAELKARAQAQAVADPRRKAALEHLREVLADTTGSTLSALTEVARCADLFRPPLPLQPNGTTNPNRWSLEQIEAVTEWATREWTAPAAEADDGVWS